MKWNLFKNKIFILVLILAVGIYILFPQPARADFIGDLFNATGLTGFLNWFGNFYATYFVPIVITAVVVALTWQVELGPAIMSNFTYTTSTVSITSSSAWTVAVETFIVNTVTYTVYYVGTTAVWYATGGATLVACAEGVLCPQWGGGNAIIVPIETQNVGCNFQIPITFYIPQFQQSYAHYGYSYYVEVPGNDPEGPSSIQVPVSSNERFQDSNCAIPDTNGNYAKPHAYGNYYAYGCWTPVHTVAGPQCGATPNFDETQNQIALYRFTVPADTSPTGLGFWFLYNLQNFMPLNRNLWYYLLSADEQMLLNNPISANVGNGYLSVNTMIRESMYDTSADYGNSCFETPTTNYWTSSDFQPSALNQRREISYHDFCSGNVCTSLDASAPPNSIVVYVAKILGDYSNSQQTSFTCGFGSPNNRDCEIKSNKFLNTNNNSDYTQFPYYDAGGAVMGNAILGPFKTGPCPKYKCSGASCVQDDVNGTYTASNCDNACAVAPSLKSHINLSPVSFSFSGISEGATPAVQTLTISNTGNAILNWTASGVPSKSATWCHLSSNSDNIAVGDNKTYNVSVDAPSNVGSFSDCGIRISGDSNTDNSPLDVTVTYNVSAAPISACHCSRCSTISDRQWVEFDSTDSTCATVVPSSNPVTQTLNCTCTVGNAKGWYNSNYSGVCR